MTNVYIGLGSNKGSRKKNIMRALSLLSKNRQRVLKVSSFFETQPYGCEKQGPFLNAAAKIGTALPPEKLLVLLKSIEKEVGRTRSFRWGPREIDLDILFYGRRLYKSRKLSIPHADMHNRRFVLLPLKEIAPGFVHPALKKSVSKILENLDK